MNEQQVWPTDLLTRVERSIAYAHVDVDRWENDERIEEGAATDLRDTLRDLASLVEEAADAAERLERAAGRPPLTDQQAVADIADRLTWSTEGAR